MNTEINMRKRNVLLPALALTISLMSCRKARTLDDLAAMEPQVLYDLMTEHGLELIGEYATDRELTEEFIVWAINNIKTFGIPEYCRYGDYHICEMELNVAETLIDMGYLDEEQQNHSAD